MPEKVKVTVVGSGYVGMSLAVLLAQHNDVTVLDTPAVSVEEGVQRFYDWYQNYSEISNDWAE